MNLDREQAATGAFCVALTAVLVALAALSDGSYQEDGLTHFVIARGAWWFPANWFDAWGRPGATAFFALGAGIGDAPVGWFLARASSAVAVGLTAAAACRAARGLGVARPILAAILVGVQPLLFRLGYDTMTEVPSALFLALAIERAVHRSPRWSAFFLSLCFVTRFETLVFAPVWLWATWPLFRDVDARDGSARPGPPWRRWLAGAVLLGWAPIAVSGLAWMVGERPPWAALGNPSPEGGTYYGRGSVVTMLVNWVIAVGPAVALIAPFGVAAMFGRVGGRLLVGCTVAYLATHTVCFVFNLFASGGYPRFMVTLAAPSAVLAAAGLASLGRRRDGHPGFTRVAIALPLVLVGAAIAGDLEIARLVRSWGGDSPYWERIRVVLRAAAVIAFALAGAAWWRARTGRATSRVVRGIAVSTAAFLVVAQASLFFGYVGRGPSGLAPIQRASVDAARWLAEHHPGATVYAANDWVAYTLDRPRAVQRPWPWDSIAAAEPGTFYVCDVHPDDWRVGMGAETIADYESSSDYEAVYTAGRERSRVVVFVRR